MKIRCYKCNKVIVILPDQTIVASPLICSECHEKDVGPHDHDEECPNIRGALCERCIQNEKK